MNENTCGTCYACCVHMGVTELRKYPGQACKHLDGRIATARCTIYERRPQACVTYRCLWLNSNLGVEFRPNECGFIMGLYPGGCLSINVFDMDKSGEPLKEGTKLHTAIRMLIDKQDDIPFTELAVAYQKDRRAFLFKDGKVFRSTLFRTGFEDLSQVIDDKPIASYRMKEPDQ